MRTARTLEAEQRQVLRGSVSTEAKEDESSTGRVWAAGFHYVTVRSLFARSETYESLIYFTFQIFSGRGKPRITETTDTESVDMGAQLYFIIQPLHLPQCTSQFTILICASFISRHSQLLTRIMQREE
jgi:hypothetical protein